MSVCECLCLCLWFIRKKCLLCKLQLQSIPFCRRERQACGHLIDCPRFIYFTREREREREPERGRERERTREREGERKNKREGGRERTRECVKKYGMDVK